MKVDQGYVKDRGTKLRSCEAQPITIKGMITRTLRQRAGRVLRLFGQQSSLLHFPAHVEGQFRGDT